MARYKLVRRFYDGEVLHPVGAILELPVGMQPKGSILMGKAKAAPESEPDEDEDFDPELEPELAIVDANPGDTLSSLSKKGK